MQRSKQFVIYRMVGKSKEFFKQIQHRDGPLDKGTPELKKAVVLDRDSAFKWAIGEGPEWAVGELISTKEGVRVEE